MDPYSCHIRPIQPEKDAASISDLIKSCFRPWMEYDNIEYLDLLKKAGEDAIAHPYLIRLTGFPYDIPGVICEDNSGKILGVINTTDFYQGARKCSLLSNVCVESARRKEGIASRMLAEAERIKRSEDIKDLYLQARMEGNAIYHFYKNNGYMVTDLRETWILPVRKQDPVPFVSEYHKETVPNSDRERFEKLFLSRYPASILWNLDYSRKSFQTGKMAELLHRISFSADRFLRITGNNGQIKAWAAFQKTKGTTNQLWLIPNEKIREEELLKCLNLLRMEYKEDKALKIDVPAGGSGNILSAAGFTKLHTIVWMWKHL